ncbi:ketohydroxyglutarate aldolase [Ligilactobacillus sp. WILCCON 0076]|uniref:Ketohydroxyglutarate aldolase n=1 Tax=Ligilactobacillus ubinensis TaxID=2876789 RepID=A0A9X2JMG3_9LACO|nr:ketohydroxyglutarate aldolase [Ligilactobacillus ubinensis]MCP0888013.1 ketohydroxyglutarate aldolase [Ligilactobacillus ubinensis]
MRKLNYTKKIYDSGALAIVRDKTDRILEIAEGITKGGINVIEVSYTNENAPEAIEKLRTKFNEKLLVGAGTILDGETAKDAIAHGAQFIYSPMFDIQVSKLANQYQIPYAPGCTSVTEAVEALRAGATFIKIFPYGGIVGTDLIKTLKTPIPYLPLIESGGINIDNANKWLMAGADILGIGSTFSKGSVSEITEKARKIRDIIDNFRN